MLKVGSKTPVISSWYLIKETRAALMGIAKDFSDAAPQSGPLTIEKRAPALVIAIMAALCAYRVYDL